MFGAMLNGMQLVKKNEIGKKLNFDCFKSTKAMPTAV